MNPSLRKSGPKSIGNVLSELMARRGYARVRSAETFEAAWREAAGPLTAQYTRVGQLRRGTLELIVANSALVQELGFQKENLLATMSRLLPDEAIQNLRFRVGNTEG
jgi:predicted nucleic acid-binding Zn ribbon protein